MLFVFDIGGGSGTHKWYTQGSHCMRIIPCHHPQQYRLRFLDASAITARFSDFLSEREMRDLLHRRNNVLVYLDRLVENQVCGVGGCVL